MNSLLRLAAAVTQALLAVVALPVLVAFALVGRRRGRELVWGPVPILNNKYWSLAMRSGGWQSTTVMREHYAINEKSDFDHYFEDLTPRMLPSRLRGLLGPFAAAAYILRRGQVLHMPFTGGPLAETVLRKLEAHLLRLGGVRTVIIPYGSDAYLYSRVPDAAIRNALLSSYPRMGRDEAPLRRRIDYWCKHADAIVMSWTLDGIPRWDIPVTNMICIDVDAIDAANSRAGHDGRTGVVRIAHTPNHRGVKGTEFLLNAVDTLREEGLQIEFVLVERRSNTEVLALMREVDILADQFALVGYGLAAIEGMAHGLPVICNLELRHYTRLFRRYSFLDECPIMSASPETLTDVLRSLVLDPALRDRLGAAGRTYVARYHSYAATQHLFGSIYRKIVDGEEVDLMNLFHPLKSTYGRDWQRIDHGLVENRLAR
jgi:glycosyltransferase involved in cell wall biosynthesis